MTPPHVNDVGGDPYLVACWWATHRWPVMPVGTKLHKDGKWEKSVPLATPEHGGIEPPDKVLGLRRGKTKGCGGFHQATLDHATLRRYFPEGCTHHVGTPGRMDMFILDWDREGAEAEWLILNPALARSYQRFKAQTFVVQTRDDQPDRIHLYCGLLPGMQPPLRKGAGDFGEYNARNMGLDIKSGLSNDAMTEGFVVLPGGGPRPDGHGEYRVVNGHPDSIATVPVELYEHLTRPEPKPEVRRGGGVSLKPSTFSSGTAAPSIPTEKRPVGSPRHFDLCSLTGKMWSQGYAREIIRAAVYAFNDATFVDPKPRADVDSRVVDDICDRYPQGEPIDLGTPTLPEVATPVAPPTPNESGGSEPDPSPEVAPQAATPLRERDSQNRLCVPFDASGYGEAMGLTDWEVRENGGYPECREGKLSEWSHCGAVEMAVIAEDIAAKACFSRHGHLEPLRVGGALRRDWFSVLSRRNAVAVDAEDREEHGVVEDVEKWCRGLVTESIAVTVNELVEKSGVLQTFECPGQSKAQIRELAKRGARLALWRYRRVRTQAGGNAVKRWCSPAYQGPESEPELARIRTSHVGRRVRVTG